jgi:hypothetical protein
MPEEPMGPVPSKTGVEEGSDFGARDDEVFPAIAAQPEYEGEDSAYAGQEQIADSGYAAGEADVFPAAAMPAEYEGEDSAEEIDASYLAALEAEEEIDRSGQAENEFDANPGAGSGDQQAPSWVMSAELSDLTQAELLERLALSMERGPGSPAAAAALPLADPLSGQEAAQQAPSPAVYDQPGVTVGSVAASRVSEGPVAQLSETAKQQSAKTSSPLRPITFGEGDEDDDDSLPSIVPPRYMSVKYALENAIEDAYEPLEAAQEDGGAEGDGTYSSLLNLARPDRRRRGLDSGKNKPLVMFPRDGSPMPGPFTGSEGGKGPDAVPTSYMPAGPEGGNNGFDQPGEPGMPAGMADTQNPEDTEQSLKAALESLRNTGGNG